MSDELKRIKQQKAEQQQIAQAEAMVKQAMTQDALQRYGNIKAAYPDRALQIIGVCMHLIQQGQKTIDDITLKKVLEQLTPKKRDIKIKRTGF